MSEELVVEYSDSGIATVREKWYTEEIAQRERRQTLEYAEKVSELVDESRRRAEALARELAEQLQSAVLAERKKADRSLETKFRELAETWYMETMPLSSYIEKILHPSYQKILVLGRGVVPLIMNELRDMPNDWFWALRILTDTDPVKPEQAGDMQAMADAWLNWWEHYGPMWREHNQI
jgi:hypothetical protein